MRYCMNYNKLSRYKNEVDELFVKYENGNISNFMKEHQHQRIIFIVDDVEYFFETGGDAMISLYPNSLIAIQKDGLEKFHQKTNERPFDIKFLILSPCDSWESLREMIYYGVKDVYITGELAFDIKQVAEVCHAHHINIRVICNAAQGFKDFDDITKFWIRPDDASAYGQYIDVLEIKHSTYKFDDMTYKAYAIDKTWFGKLNELILDMEDDIDNRSLLPALGIRRMNCRKKCFRDSDSCKVCILIKGVSQKMHDEGYIFKEK